MIKNLSSNSLQGAIPKILLTALLLAPPWLGSAKAGVVEFRNAPPKSDHSVAGAMPDAAVTYAPDSATENPVTQALLEDNPLALCFGHGELTSMLYTDWEAGLGAWTVDTHDIANPATFGTPDWAVVQDLPSGRSGQAAFVANLDIGDCAADDQSGALTLDSPDIQIPQGTTVPRIAIDHWIATEIGYDGGNFKISVNGGSYAPIPPSAIEVSPYNGVLLRADLGNTNPLAGQAAFTGSDDGITGSWGQSNINLFGIAGAGDSIRLRFDFGVDGCRGLVGWYVDDVQVYSCADEPPPSDCGNSLLDAGEQCDDGNTYSGDGCSNFCEVEDGWQCENPTHPLVVSDGSFEAGTPNPFWTETSTNFDSPICNESDCTTGTGTGPADGLYWAWFGGMELYEEGAVSQSMVIPVTSEALVFELEVSECDSPADYLEVLIDGNQEYFIDGSSALCGGLGYTPQSVDLSAYADGSSHTIEFHSESFSTNADVSNFFVDAVEITGKDSICTPVNLGLTLNKVVVNDNGGMATASDWTLSATGPTSFSGPGPSVSSGAGFAAGTYTLSESAGPGGYEASAWVCVGGSQVDADTIILADGEHATCTITNDDIATPIQINAGHTGAWFNPETAGQGQFIEIDPESRFMFISWFTYTDADSDSPFEQRWLTAQGNYSGDRAVLTLYETLGGRFDDPQGVSTSPIGEVTLNFTDCNQGEMAYTFDEEGLQGSFPLIRAIPGSGNVCEERSANATQAVDINLGMDGAWFDPETSGQGFFVDVHSSPEHGNFIFVSWFTYGEETASGQRWLTAQGTFRGSSATIGVNETTGGSFDDPLAPTTVRIGEMTLDFSDCSNAALTYSLTDEGAEGDIALTRVVSGTEALCQEYAETQ